MKISFGITKNKIVMFIHLPSLVFLNENFTPCLNAGSTLSEAKTWSIFWRWIESWRGCDILNGKQIILFSLIKFQEQKLQTLYSEQKNIIEQCWLNSSRSLINPLYVSLNNGRSVHNQYIYLCRKCCNLYSQNEIKRLSIYWIGIALGSIDPKYYLLKYDRRKLIKF